MRDLNQFVEVTSAVGKNAAYVQGGGGNTSLKLDDQKMVVKSSGVPMAAVTLKSGFCVVDYPKIMTLIDQELDYPTLTANAFSKSLSDCVSEADGGRPSMETGFHAVLKRFVLHTHSIYANMLTCAIEGEALVKQLFPEAIWVPYATPGLDVTLRIKELMGSKFPSILFLQNHGLIVSADSPEDGGMLHNHIHKTLKSHFKMDIEFDEISANGDAHFLESHILFPDQVIYTSDSSLRVTKAGIETQAAYFAVLKLMEDNRLTPHFLSANHASILLNMESEKFRQKLMKKE